MWWLGSGGKNQRWRVLEEPLRHGRAMGRATDKGGQCLRDGGLWPTLAQ